MNTLVKLAFGSAAAVTAILVVCFGVWNIRPVAPATNAGGALARREITVDRARVQADGGPVAEGLQLRFALQTSSNVGGELHECSLSLANVSSEPVTLAAMTVRPEGDTVGYADLLPNQVGFLVYPDVRPIQVQRVSSPWTGALSHTLAPGDDITLRWSCAGPELSWNGEFRWRNAGYRFASDGLYLVRAEADLETSDGRSIHLWSNEQPFVVGGSFERPKQPCVNVFNPDERAGTVTLGVGTDRGAHVGDRYVVQRTLGEGWKLEIIKTDVMTSLAKATYFGPGSSDYGGTMFPRPPEVAILQGREER